VHADAAYALTERAWGESAALRHSQFELAACPRTNTHPTAYVSARTNASRDI